jgi:hypothetical protein
MAAERQALTATADNITGHVSSLSGDPKVTIKQAKDNKPVAGLLVKFKTGGQGIEGCSASTNTEGVAQCYASQLNPVFCADAVISGYDAIFEGNEEYQPVKAHGKVTPGL